MQAASQAVDRPAHAEAAAVERVRVDHGLTEVFAGLLEREPTALIRQHIGEVLDLCAAACGQCAGGGARRDALRRA